RAVADAGRESEDPAQADGRAQHRRSTLAAGEIDPACESRLLFPTEQSRARGLSQVEPDRIQRLDPLGPGRRLPWPVVDLEFRGSFDRLDVQGEPCRVRKLVSEAVSVIVRHIDREGLLLSRVAEISQL